MEKESKEARKVAKRINVITKLIGLIFFLVLCYMLKISWTIILAIIICSIIFEKIVYILVFKVLDKRYKTISKE